MNERPDLKSDGFTYVAGRHVPGIERLVELSEEHQLALEVDSVKLVKQLTGVTSAFVYGATFRDHSQTSWASRGPVAVIHSDMSPAGATYMKNSAQNLFLKSTDPSEVGFGKYLETGQDVIMLNVWRPIHAVEDNHLGICKWGSLLEEDALKSNIIPTHVGNTLQPWKYREGQEWYYLKNQQPHEVYVFLQHDDRAKEDGHGINVPHASFKLQGHDKPSTRVSFEAKIIALIDPSPPEGRISRLSNHMTAFANRFSWDELELLELHGRPGSP
ncbi:uncharacterized protein MELLADRAFT_93125 [Melampsora larici-populina 98AG31]|uniref:Uncharacterized protein n=1 Tax=Melampsora larici-populina (strain 98AG31 / pathotype 3-4-7) TaxID=747676 RepID=F4S408_MELLP|nr:uncharacterized protein MELLADRAFT_93125 [Melampsora larici-populina 98AG31]EGG00643.1 hypothetical protein MELLADRAFT_93125 [Melampsora larici-populina 98AG31]